MAQNTSDGMSPKTPFILSTAKNKTKFRQKYNIYYMQVSALICSPEEQKTSPETDLCPT